MAILLITRSAQADINKRSYNKSYQEDSPETVGAQGGVLGDGVIELHNLQAGGDEPKLKGRINQTNLLDMNDHPKETWCRCASALNPKSCLKGLRRFSKGQTKPFQKNTVTLLDLEGNEDLISYHVFQIGILLNIGLR